MIKYLLSILLYFYFLFFKSKIKVDFPCKVSPHFAWKVNGSLKNVILGSAFLGRDVEIAEGCCFYENPMIFGKVNIGRYTSINGPGTRICAEINTVSIGSFCSIASNVIIQEYNHEYNKASTYFILSHIFGEKTNETTSKGDVIIEDDVWIGSNVVILSGVKIGRGSIIGAGSIVNKDVPAYSIVGGNPAKILKSRFSESSIIEIEASKWWNWDIKKMRMNKEFFTRKFQ